MSYCSETQAQHFPGVMGSSGSQSHRWESNEQWRTAIRKCLSYKISLLLRLHLQRNQHSLIILFALLSRTNLSASFPKALIYKLLCLTHRAWLLLAKMSCCFPTPNASHSHLQEKTKKCWKLCDPGEFPLVAASSLNHSFSASPLHMGHLRNYWEHWRIVQQPWYQCFWPWKSHSFKDVPTADCDGCSLGCSVRKQGMVINTPRHR